MIFSTKEHYYCLEYEAFCGFQIVFGMTVPRGSNTAGAHLRKTHQRGYSEAVIFCTEHIETEPSVNTWHCRTDSQSMPLQRDSHRAELCKEIQEIQHLIFEV